VTPPQKILIVFLGENPGGVGSLLCKAEIEARLGVRYRLRLFDEWLQSLGRTGAIFFSDYGAGGVCYHPDDVDLERFRGGASA
jgi:hypothetical protein